MATNTKNYNLVKPAGNELADINVINQNMDVIDEQIQPVNSLASEESKKALAAAQGKVLNDKIGDLSKLTTKDKDNLVQAINDAADGSGVTVVTESEYKSMQESGTVKPDKLYGIVDAFDSSASNVGISDTLADKLGITADKNVEKAIDAVDAKVGQNAEAVAEVNRAVLKKDGSVQMTGALKTIGNNTQDIVSGKNGLVSYNDSFMIASNCYWDGTDWRYSSDGKAMYMWVNATNSGCTQTTMAMGVKDTICKPTGEGSITSILLTDSTGLPLTGGTLSGTLNVNSMLQIFSASKDPTKPMSRIAKALYDRDYGSDIIDIDANGVMRYLRVGGSAYTDEINRLLYITQNADGSNGVCRCVYHTGNITVSTSAPSAALAEGAQHQVYA